MSVCSWCNEFGIERWQSIKDDFVDLGIYSVVLIPWWGSDWTKSPDFEFHFGLKCLPADKRSTAFVKMFSYYRDPPISRDEAYCVLRGIGGDLPDFLSCYSDPDARKLFAQQTEQISSVLGSGAARMFVGGNEYSIHDDAALRAALVGGDPKTTSNNRDGVPRGL